MALLAVLTEALADFTGRVVKVSDGDTLTVLVNETQIRVRLDANDAPESKQALGKRSQQSLAELCAAKDAHVSERGKDRYERTIGVVTCATVEANSEQDGLGVRPIRSSGLTALQAAMGSAGNAAGPVG